METLAVEGVPYGDAYVVLMQASPQKLIKG